MTDEQIDGLQRENAHLRVIAQKVGCPYGHRNERGICNLGYPGCACMDDLLAMTAWQTEDEEKAGVRLGEQVAQLTAEREELRRQLAEWESDADNAAFYLGRRTEQVQTLKLRQKLNEAAQLLKRWKAQGDIVYVAGWYTNETDIVSHELLDIDSDKFIAERNE